MKNYFKPKKIQNVTAVQIFNPTMGKGLNQEKTNKVVMKNIKGFRLVEWLKCIGMYHCSVAPNLTGSKDRKIFAVVPRQIDFHLAGTIIREFKNSLHSHGHPIISLDIRSS